MAGEMPGSGAPGLQGKLQVWGQLSRKLIVLVSGWRLIAWYPDGGSLYPDLQKHADLGG